jgi:TrmH family RNA methyltransferase
MIISLTSPKNDNIKQVVQLLEKSKIRKATGMAVVEGIHEIRNSLKAGLSIEKIFYSAEITNFENVKKEINQDLDKIQVYECTPEVFKKISYRENSGGIVLVIKNPERNFQSLKFADNELLIVLESVEKPGNLGAICRIADGAGLRNIIVCDPKSDIYNPNSIRSSIGTVFNMNIISTDLNTAYEWLKLNNFKIFAAELQNSNYHFNVDYHGRTALVFGTEANGLTDFWIKNSNERIKIPMLGINDSLNVSVSVGVIIYEALRQRLLV